ncbi:MAG: FtsQ-type POTRA domain-containing protein [Oscillospiraceae bacterium]|nr:FtsQ-type POTRA domain-containing protein [Oscillospiraceae bacterium]
MDENVFNPQSKVKRRGLYYGPMTLVLIFLVIMIVLSLFFRVSEIEVVNASDYSDEQIIIASGIEKGANLFFVDRFAAASMIFSDLPYMDTISIQRQLPGKIIIQAEGSAPAAYMVVDGDYWFIDRTGKMLGVTSVLQAEKFPEIRNLEPLATIAGVDMVVEGTNVQRLSYTTELISALQAEELIDHIRWIDVKDAGNPSLFYDDRLTVYFGQMENTLYKAALLRDAVESIASEDSGTLSYAGGNAWAFSPD